jgi:hypothetical protein
MRILPRVFACSAFLQPEAFQAGQQDLIDYAEQGHVSLIVC